jgi:transposase-like protein
VPKGGRKMPIQRKQYSVDFKAKVALEAIRGMKTANEIASEYGVHPTQIAEWKKLVLERIPELFTTRGSEKNKSEEALIANLYQQIGQLKVELDFVKKKSQRFS